MSDVATTDAKLTKLAAKVSGNQKLSGGKTVTLAVPAKRGGLAAATAGAMSGSVAGVMIAQRISRGGVDKGASAGSVLAAIGDGSDFVLCFTPDDLRIVRYAAFGIMTGTPTVIPGDQLAGIDAVSGGRKDVALVFPDGSALTFQVPKPDHRAAIAGLAAQLWR